MSFLVALMVAAAHADGQQYQVQQLQRLDGKGRVPFVAILAVVLVFAVIVFSDPPRICCWFL